jgi:hypothetical protein
MLHACSESDYISTRTGGRIGVGDLTLSLDCEYLLIETFGPQLSSTLGENNLIAVNGKAATLSGGYYYKGLHG